MSKAPLYIQSLYASQLAGSLGFKKTNSYVWNGKCPLCGDSQKNKSKKRGYIYMIGQTLNYACHNCGASMSFERFLKDRNDVLYREYKLAVLKDSGQHEEEEDLGKYKTTVPKVSSWDAHFKKIVPGTEAHKYLLGRRVPDSALSRLYYSDKYADSIRGVANAYGVTLSETKIPNDHRLVIPFISPDGQPSYVQGRTLENSSIRYITSELYNDFKLFGRELIDPDKTIYVTEGPLDSLFLENAVATADSDLTKASQVYPKEKLVLVFDNEPRSKIICGKIEGALRKGFTVVLPPFGEDIKDINDAVLEGVDVQRIVQQYQFSGPAGLLRFGQWKRC